MKGFRKLVAVLPNLYSNCCVAFVRKFGASAANAHLGLYSTPVSPLPSTGPCWEQRTARRDGVERCVWLAIIRLPPLPGRLLDGPHEPPELRPGDGVDLVRIAKELSFGHRRRWGGGGPWWRRHGGRQASGSSARFSPGASPAWCFHTAPWLEKQQRGRRA